MAHARKCDRCGTYYDEKAKVGDPCLDGHFIGYLGVFTPQPMNRNIQNIDLCPGCRADFLDWLNIDHLIFGENPLKVAKEEDEINHVNCPYRKDTLCASRNLECNELCSVYKEVFGKENKE